MKNAFYLLALTVLCACNREKKETAQAVILTPTGIQGLQKSNTVQPVAQRTKSNLIFNPPHGEAGHTCALAVGAPLNQTATVQPQQKVTQQAIPAPAAVVVNNSGKKLNPKHGQPNHRCDLAVGAPLNSRPAPVVNNTPVPGPEVKTTESKVLETKTEGK